MLPRNWTRAILTLLCFLSFYIFLAFVTIEQNEGEIVEELPFQQIAGSKVLLWTNRSDHDSHRMKLPKQPHASARHISSQSEIQNRKVILAHVWPSLLNKSSDKKYGNKRQNKSISDRHTHFTEQAQCDKDSDCERLQKRLKSWPSDRPKAVIYFLTKAARLSFLKTSLESVDKYFNSRFNYPIVIFHESELRNKLSSIRQYTMSEVYFQLVNFSVPDFLTEPVVYDIPCTSKIGYRHMCRFNAKQVYEQPIMQGLDFYWRLDDDSRLLRPVTFDPFIFMAKRDLIYGYQWIHLDNSDCVTGLWEATEIYIKENNIKPYFFDEWPKPKLFYNNFEISRMDVWTSPEYKKYIDYLDRLGGMYYHRWGDAPIRGLSLSLFVPKNKTYLFKSIGYEHTSFRNP